MEWMASIIVLEKRLRRGAQLLDSLYWAARAEHHWTVFVNVISEASEDLILPICVQVGAPWITWVVIDYKLVTTAFVKSLRPSHLPFLVFPLAIPNQLLD